MEKAIVMMDRERRIYLPKALGESIKNKRFFLVKMIDRIVLIPIPEDPIKDLEELGKKLPKKSLKSFKKEIAEEAEKDVSKRLR